eukprot:1139256-Pelagomonas_calceolata.AAC.1
MLSASKVPMQDFIGDLRYRQQRVWREADALSPREVNRKAVAYHRWCGRPLNQTARAPFWIPRKKRLEKKRKEKKRKRKTTKAVKHSLHQLRKGGHIGAQTV